MEKNLIEKHIEVNDVLIKGYYNTFTWHVSLYFYDHTSIDLLVWKWGLIWKPKLIDTKENGLDELFEYYENDYKKVYELLRLIKLELTKINKLT